MYSIKEAVQALAHSGKIQLSLFPEGSAKIDELALDFNDTLKYWIPRIGPDLSEKQKLYLEELDGMLDKMSGEENWNLWTEEALLSDNAWENVRLMAKNVLEEFGWKLEIPPKRF